MCVFFIVYGSGRSRVWYRDKYAEEATEEFETEH